MSAAQRIQEKFAVACTEQLAKFGKETPGIGLVVLSTGDGFEVASCHVDRTLSAKIAAMGSSLQALSDAITHEVGLKAGRKLLIESDDGYVLAIGINDIRPMLSLVIVADRTASLGHLLWSAKNCSASLVRVMKG